jgi:hypothetical protein
MGRSVSGVLAGVVLVACLDTHAPKVIQIEVQPSSAALGENESLVFSATVRSDGQIVPDAKVVWSIDNADLASIDSNGRATVGSVSVEGSAAVVATYAGLQGKAALSVKGCVTECGTWTVVNESVPYWRNSGSAVIDGILYVAGGVSSAKFSVGEQATLRACNPATGLAIEKAPMPSARTEAGVGVIDGKLYVVGGFDANYVLTSGMAVYDPATDVWTTLAPMPTRRSAPVAVLNGLLYVVGGFSSTGQGGCCAGLTTTVEAYDPKTNTWTTRTALPAVGTGFPIVLDGVIYYFGGANGDTYTYDPRADSWSTRPKSGSEPSGSAAAIAHKIYFVDGTGKVTAFDPVANRSIRKASVGRTVGRIVGADGAMYGFSMDGSSLSSAALLRFMP